MKIQDRIYNEFTIEDQVISDLIKSNPVQRLKKISQDGAPHFIQPVRDVTRFEHSIGVWYLSNRFDCPIEEQIAALLHDIPHTAFSHVIDFVIEDKNHEFHDQFTNEIILSSEIPAILERHNIDVEKVLHKENYDLLENNLPDISLDRLDYFLRDGFTMGFLTTTVIIDILNGLKVEDSRFYFTDYRLASLAAILFANFSRLIWLDPTSHGSFFLIAEAIKIALRKEYITQEDFFTNDETLMGKLKDSNDHEILMLLDRLKSGGEFEYADKADAEFYGPNKPRVINPLVKTDDGLKRVTELVPSLGYFFAEFTQRYQEIGVVQNPL